MQYAISFNDRMSTYGSYNTAKFQDNYYIEAVTGIINAECEKGAKFVDVIYVDNRPTILVFEKIIEKKVVKKPIQKSL